MNLGGWIIMALSVGTVTCLFVWCITRVLRDPRGAERLHGTREGDLGLEPEDKV